MVCLKRSANAAIRAPRLPLRKEVPPFLGGEATAGECLSSSASGVYNLPDLGMRAAVLFEIGVLLFRVPLPVRSISGQPRRRIVRSPAPHRLLRMLEMALPHALDVLALVGATLFWV